MQAQIGQQSNVVTQLKQNMVKLESKISEAKTKKDLYVARARSAKASQQINDMLGRVGTGGAIQAFERMEEKVLQMEAQAEAVAELGMDDLEKRIVALGEADDVEAELAAMKTQMIGGSEAKAQLPASESIPKPIRNWKNCDRGSKAPEISLKKSTVIGRSPLEVSTLEREHLFVQSAKELLKLNVA